MFFIGIFGFDGKIKELGSLPNKICPSCGQLTSLHLYKTYSFFHIFFLPVAKWNVKYIAKTNCCEAVFEVENSVGKQFEEGIINDIDEKNLKVLEKGIFRKHCEECKAAFNGNYEFCPYCGKKL